MTGNQYFLSSNSSVHIKLIYLFIEIIAAQFPCRDGELCVEQVELNFEGTTFRLDGALPNTRTILRTMPDAGQALPRYTQANGPRPSRSVN